MAHASDALETSPSFIILSRNACSKAPLESGSNHDGRDNQQAAKHQLPPADRKACTRREIQ